MRVVTVRVPASTSNLGPGFDCLGVALRLYNRVRIVRNETDSNPPMVDEAARFFFKRTGLSPFRFSCSISGDIPRSRGLGSSAAVRLGVLCALNRLSKNPLDRLAIFHLSTQLEGHPDNAAPACFGGFTIARPDKVQRFDVSPRLRFVLLVPDFEIKTSLARKILPARIVRTNATESSANACAITAAFVSRDYRQLKGVFADEFHQPFRQKLVPFLSRVVTAAEKAGALGAFLSGSGSTIAAVTLEDPQRVAQAMLQAAKTAGAQTRIVSTDNGGACILPVRSRK